MGHVFLEMTMTVDGFTAGPGVSLEHPLGIGGEDVHEWTRGSREPAEVGLGPEGAADAAPDEVDLSVIARRFDTTGAFVIGRRTFDVGEPPWGADESFGHRPVFVVTHRPHEEPDTGQFTFVDGFEQAIERAREVAGDKDVAIGGGADVIRQGLAAGYIDELAILVAPVILGGGKALFDGFTASLELEQIGVRQMEWVTLLEYRVRK